MIYLDCYTGSQHMMEFDVDAISKPLSNQFCHLCDLLALVFERHPVLIRTAIEYLYQHRYDAVTRYTNSPDSYESWERHFTPRECGILEDLFRKIYQHKIHVSKTDRAVAISGGTCGYITVGSVTIYNNNEDLSIIVLLSKKGVL